MRVITILLIAFLSLNGWGQPVNKDTANNNPFPSIEDLLKSSETISNQTFDLKFLLRALPDNGWYLKLNKDASFEYIHWSGFGAPEGTVLEKGKYSINNNQLKLEPNESNSTLSSARLFIVTSSAENIDNNITIDCVRMGSKIYCLHHN